MVLLLLTSGAIINVAVAWGFVQWSDYTFPSDDYDRYVRSIEPVDERWLRRSDESATGTNILELTGPGLIQRRVFLRDAVVDARFEAALRNTLERTGATGQSICISPASECPWLEIRACGWPDISVNAAMWMHSETFLQVRKLDDPLDRLEIQGGIRFGHRPVAITNAFDSRSIKVFPWNPVWPGFAINTVFYAAVLWLLFAAPRMPGFVRRRIRARRGQCPTCGYQIAPGTCSGGICSECGAAVMGGRT